MTRKDTFDLNFPWPLLRSMVAGESAIDVPRLTLRTLGEAEAFIEGYGYDWQSNRHTALLESIRIEAWEFIEEELLSDLNLRPDHAIRSESDLRVLLLLASNPGAERSVEQKWACALLRVMHTFAHARAYFNEHYGDAIRNQILSRFEPHLHMSLQGLVLGTSPGIELIEFEVKPAKPARSVVMKLLQKPENVAADIFDRIGVRFVTRERFDALLVVKYLRQNNVVMFANIKPSRSRNTLINLDAVAADLEVSRERVERGEWTAEEQLQWMRKQAREREYPGAPEPSYNPFSALAYHSIQFTCRQLIRVPAPHSDEEIDFFFPYEVQVLDERSYHDSRSGFSSHDHYKERQKDAVIQRVLKGLL